MKQSRSTDLDTIISFLSPDGSILQKESDLKTHMLQDFVDNASIGLHWVDANGIIKWANKAELDMLGYTGEEYIGHHISEFHVHKEKISDILHRLSCNETLNQYESELRCKDGTVKTVLLSSNVLWHEGKFIHTRCFTVDVTEKKKLYNDLVESEKRYKKLVTTLPAGMYTCNKEGKITFFNEQAVDLWGYRPDSNDDLLKFYACYKVWLMDGTLVPPEKAPMAIAIQTGQGFKNIEVRIQRPDGSQWYACLNIEPLFDDHDNLIGAINIFQDITHLKQTELELRKSETRYKNLIQSLATPLYTTDTMGRITMYNKAAADLWGKEPEIGKDMWCGSYRIFNTDGTQMPLDTCPMAVCLNEKRAVYGEEILVARPDGSIRHVAPHPQPLFDDEGNMTGAINMLIDITDIKRAEIALREGERKYKELSVSLEKKVEEKTADLKLKNEQLRTSEERYHKMVEEVEDYAIILLDKNGIVQNWNRGAEKIKGYKEEEIVGKSFSQFYLPEDRAAKQPEKILDEAREKGKALYEGWRRRKDGSRFWGSIVLTALHDHENNIIGFSKVTRDLTQKKLAEDRMQEYTNQLEFKNKELEQFSYAASHDMKEPLRKIAFYVSAVSEKLEGHIDEKSAEFLQRAVGAARRMNELIEDLLTYARTNSREENFEAVDLNQLIDEIASLHKDEFEQKIVHIKTENLGTIFGIPFQVKQLLDNLITNSVKYRHPEKACVIHIKGEITSQLPTQQKTGFKQYYHLSVSDNGIGFEQEYSEKIFDIFQRLHNAPNAKGSGIGLALCKRIVENHRGFITATGKKNEGACFDLYFPLGEN
ncbi:MAG: PAS domain S-box protein [Flavisolibacter sp.]|nr:PAS domain S-box protein [Flavisolibacter sp.]